MRDGGALRRACARGEGCGGRRMKARSPRAALAASVFALLSTRAHPAAADVLSPDPDAEADFTRPFEEINAREYGLGVATMYLRYAHARDGDALGGASDIGLGGLSARGLYTGGGRVGYAAGVGVELG